VITSYGTLRQDAELLASMDWCVVIGDEAQHIKNRRSQNAKTLMSLRTEGRFLLTGTPVENSLDDLFSLFSFLMPGYMQKPTGKLSLDDKAWHNQRQTKRAAAYILRRTKSEVAPELPDKIEKTFFCELGVSSNASTKKLLRKPVVIFSIWKCLVRTEVVFNSPLLPNCSAYAKLASIHAF
jgi:SNF2 family DNA or RNA helicase